MVTEDKIREALLNMALLNYPDVSWGDGHSAVCFVLNNASKSSDTFCQQLADQLFLLQ